MIRMLTCALILLLAGQAAPLAHEHHAAAPESASDGRADLPLRIPDVPVLDQDGRTLSFYRDLVRGRAVAIDFIYTQCDTTCPTLSATLQEVQDRLGARVGQDVALISVSVDPVTDTPARLHAYAGTFGAKPGWSFVTGARRDMDVLLRGLGAAAPRPGDHPALMLIGSGRTGRFTRVQGLGSPDVLVDLIERAAATGAAAQRSSGRYFTNLPLVDQNGGAVRFYDGVLRDGVAVIAATYTTCPDACPLLADALAQAQRLLPPELARAVRFVAISTDPEADTPEALRRFAGEHGLGNGWTLLTGAKANVDWVLYRLGLHTEDKRDHPAAILVGNDAAGAWVRLPPGSDSSAIAEAIGRVAAIQGGP